MKRSLKILGYFILLLVVLLVITALFFNSRYNSVARAMEIEKQALDNSHTDFFTFRLDQFDDQLPILLPVPKKFNWKDETFVVPSEWRFKSSEAIPQIEIWLENFTGLASSRVNSSSNISFTNNASIHREGYRLAINSKDIKIEYSTDQGIYYALITLGQLIKQYPERINGLRIEDEPDMEIRGVMLDISRDKVPKLSTLFEIVDQLAFLKMNHLQLYVEGFSFAYPSYSELWEGKETPITPDEIRQLDEYCKARFIDLAANQNSLGHMAAWLKSKQYEDLAECPKGYSLVPMMKMKTTLNPLDPHSIELVKGMMDDMIPHFSSSIFNANLDEPFELGKCRSKDQADEIGVDHVYLDYTKKVYEYAKSYNKDFWMWGDIVNKHPEIIELLPKDITLLEWGYEHDHPFKKNTDRYKSAGLEFLVCPGTSSWMSLVGRTENMMGNISNAVKSGMANGAKGMLLTDWGDMGHWQYLPVSFTGFAYSAGVSWNASTDSNLPLESFLNTFIFKDDKNNMARVAMEIGRINQFEEIEMPNSTQAFMAYQFGLMDPVLEHTVFNGIQAMIGDVAGPEMVESMQKRFDNNKPYDYQNLSKHLDNIENTLNQETELELKQINIVKDEFRNGIRMVRLGAMLKEYNASNSEWSYDESSKSLVEMKSLITDIQSEHKRLWLERNKPGGLDRSMKKFVDLESSIDKQIDLMNGGVLGKRMDLLKDKIIAGGVNWYLD